MKFKYKIKKIPNIESSFLINSSYFLDIRGNISTIFNNEMQKRIIKKKFNNFHDKIMVRKKNTLTGIHGDKKLGKF